MAGYAELLVAPEFLGELRAWLPGSVKIIGSTKAEGYVGLVIQSDEWADGEHLVTLTVKETSLGRCAHFVVTGKCKPGLVLGGGATRVSPLHQGVATTPGTTTPGT